MEMDMEMKSNYSETFQLSLEVVTSHNFVYLQSTHIKKVYLVLTRSAVTNKTCIGHHEIILYIIG